MVIYHIKPQCHCAQQKAEYVPHHAYNTAHKCSAKTERYIKINETKRSMLKVQGLARNNQG